MKKKNNSRETVRYVIEKDRAEFHYGSYSAAREAANKYFKSNYRIYREERLLMFEMDGAQ